MTAETTVNTIINNALATATAKSDAAQAFSQEAITAIDEASFALSSPPTFSGGPSTPTYQGDLTDDPSVSFKSDLDADAATITAKLAGIFSGFLNTYFPGSTAALTAAETWLANAINNGGTGIPAAVEAQIWERSRARELKDAARLEEEANSSLAARGFSMPPGALSAKLQEIQQAAADKISTHSRDVAIKQAELEIENIRFAVQQAIQHRATAISAAIDYWRAYLLPEDIAARKALANAELKMKFQNTAMDYYRAQIALYNAQVQEGGQFFDAANRAYMAQAEAKVGLGRAKADAATSAAKAAGDIAAAAMAAINTLTQYGYTENQEL